MPAAAGHLHGVWSSGVDLDSEEGRRFLQARLAFFGQVGFFLGFGYFCLAYVVLGLSTSWAALSP